RSFIQPISTRRAGSELRDGEFAFTMYIGLRSAGERLRLARGQYRFECGGAASTAITEPFARRVSPV
ncbi:MAG: hypothetical protein WCA23_29395, partial [Stellaceae bacterium]